MSKTKEELLLEYKRINKDDRPAVIKKAGYETEAAYLEYLMSDDEERPLIHSVYIIDISDSMRGGKIDAAVMGVNTEIDELKKDSTAEYLQTIVEFSGPENIKTVVSKLPIAHVSPYTTRTISSTALNQTVGETLTRLRKEKSAKEKILVKIFTDGQENASQGEFKNYAVLHKLIKDCEEEGFTITFVGTERDIAHVVQFMGMECSNTLAHDNSVESVRGAFMASTNATLNYVKNVKARKAVRKGFYKDIK